MTNSSKLGSAAVFSALLMVSACQKSDNEDHVFKTQEMALKKAQQLQNSLADKFEKDAKRLQQATE